MTATLEQLEHHWQQWLEKRKKGIIRDEEYPYAEQLLYHRKRAMSTKKAVGAEVDDNAGTDTVTNTAQP